MKGKGNRKNKKKLKNAPLEKLGCKKKKNIEMGIKINRSVALYFLFKIKKKRKIVKSSVSFASCCSRLCKCKNKIYVFFIFMQHEGCPV